MTSTTPSYTQQVKSVEEDRKANQLHDELRQMLFEGHCPRRLHQNVRLLLEAYERALEGGKGVSPAGFLLLGNIWLSQIRDHMAEQNHEQGIQENIHALIMERAKSRLRALQADPPPCKECRAYCGAFRNFLQGKSIPAILRDERDMVIGPEEFLRLTARFTLLLAGKKLAA